MPFFIINYDGGRKTRNFNRMQAKKSRGIAPPIKVQIHIFHRSNPTRNDRNKSIKKISTRIFYLFILYHSLTHVKLQIFFIIEYTHNTFETFAIYFLTNSHTKIPALNSKPTVLYFGHPMHQSFSRPSCSHSRKSVPPPPYLSPHLPLYPFPPWWSRGAHPPPLLSSGAVAVGLGRRIVGPLPFAGFRNAFENIFIYNYYYYYIIHFGSFVFWNCVLCCAGVEDSFRWWVSFCF